jgi:hypothetical protein
VSTAGCTTRRSPLVRKTTIGTTSGSVEALWARTSALWSRTRLSQSSERSVMVASPEFSM